MSDSIKLNDGTSVPLVAFGTGTAVYKKDAYDQVMTALDAGATHIDTAQLYQNEESVGKALKDYLSRPGVKREDIYVTTKLADLAAGESVAHALKTSLRKLQLDYVDLYLIHSPVQHTGKLVEVWKGMEEVKKLGLAKSIGVSNWRVKDYEEILPSATVIPSVNQIELHPFVFRASIPLLELHRKHNITIAAYGALSPITKQDDAAFNKVLAEIAKRLATATSSEVTEGDILLKWIAQQGHIIVTTTSKTERAKEYLGVPKLANLQPEDIKLIESSVGDRHKRFFVGPPLPERDSWLM